MKCPRCNGSGTVKDPSSLAERLTWLRESRGLTRLQVEEATAIGHSTYWRLENGTGKRITVELLVKLADCFKVSVDDILGRKP